MLMELSYPIRMNCISRAWLQVPEPWGGQVALLAWVAKASSV
jgi:hypothetical protein